MFLIRPYNILSGSTCVVKCVYIRYTRSDTCIMCILTFDVRTYAMCAVRAHLGTYLTRDTCRKCAGGLNGENATIVDQNTYSVYSNYTTMGITHYNDAVRFSTFFFYVSSFSFLRRRFAFFFCFFFYLLDYAVTRTRV